MINIEEDDNLSSIFYNTNHFEVFCFHQIFIFQNKNNIMKEKTKLYKNYFLVGGFDINKKKGIIKLFKINFAEKYNEKKIEYIEEIKNIDKKFKGFNAPISYITQSSKTGEILACCWDGKIYSLEEPNIMIYLKYDNKNEKFIISKVFLWVKLDAK